MTRPRLGFVGVGWIGRHRLQAVAEHGGAEIAAIADPIRDHREAAAKHAPRAVLCERVSQLLELPLDGIVVATPSALHAEHCLASLARGRAVFCQKPLGRSAPETALVVDAARNSDRLLAVDFSYRFTAAMRAIRELVTGGELGEVFAIDLVFHNAYGPDAAWFYDKTSSGGGCVIDLGVHLVDLALWLLEFPQVLGVDSRLFAKGHAIEPSGPEIEDFANVHVHLAGRAGQRVIARLACSWRASAGRDAVIEAQVFGTTGGAAMRNIGGSFYDFVGERYRGTKTEPLASPPDAWGGRAIVDWVERLAGGAHFDPMTERLVDVARVVDAIYERGIANRMRGVA